MKITMWILAIPKTIYLNFKIFNFKTAVKFPIICSHKVRINKGLKRGCISIYGKILRGMIRLGMSNGSFTNGRDSTSFLSIEEGSKIIFLGKSTIDNNFLISVGSEGIVEIGDNFCSNYGLLISCSKSIKFGHDTIIGWNCSFIDGDGHRILDNGISTNNNSAISIGNHVWIGSNVSCLKGVEVADECVVALSAVLTKKYIEKGCIIGGNPAKILKKNIQWQK